VHRIVAPCLSYHNAMGCGMRASRLAPLSQVGAGQGRGMRLQQTGTDASGKREPGYDDVVFAIFERLGSARLSPPRCSCPSARVLICFLFPPQRRPHDRPGLRSYVDWRIRSLSRGHLCAPLRSTIPAPWCSCVACWTLVSFPFHPAGTSSRNDLALRFLAFARAVIYVARV
jgi:hypothetical protein